MEKKRGLGRGLDNFFGTQPMDDVNEVNTLPIEEIKANPKQPRKQFSEESLEELAESIRSVGVLQPLLIKKEKDDNLLIAGERRFKSYRRRRRLRDFEEKVRIHSRKNCRSRGKIQTLYRQCHASFKARARGKGDAQKRRTHRKSGEITSVH